MNYPLVIVKFRDVIQDSSWDGPDTSTTDSGDSFYRLVVTTEQTYLGNDPNQNQITPGMDAIVEIKVGSQSVLDFLLRPVLKLSLIHI